MKTKLFILSFYLFALTCYGQCFSTISAGYQHNAGLKPDGTVWVWGWGNWGQLNNGPDGFDEYNPIVFSNASNWQFVTSSQHNTFAIATNGTLWGCGGNTFGSLGIGSTITNSYVILQIGTASNWKQIAAGNITTLGLKTDNSIWGWGFNDSYQVGDGTLTNRLTPVQIGSATDWKSIGCSYIRSGFAIKNNGTLWGWGGNSTGLLGGDSSVTVRTVPTQLNTATDWDKMSVGYAHILVVKTNGTLWVWGDGGNGETGQSPPGSFNPYAPFQIAGAWKAIAAGCRFSMGIKTNGTLWAWGQDDVGQLGDGGTTDRYIPVQLGTATNWESVSCGCRHTVALRTDGSLWSWGTNDYGQLGTGDTTAVAAPAQVPITGCTLSVAEFSAQNTMQISPNPVSSDVTISYKGISTVDTIVVYDLSGREVYTLEALGNNAFSSSFSIAALSSGTYVVVLKNKGVTVVSSKVVKE